jgi:hypothetical protein
MDIIRERFAAYKAGFVSRKSNPVSCAGACSGLGKSRLLHEFGHHLSNTLAQSSVCEDVHLSWVVTIAMTYNTGHNPVPDELNGTLSAQSSFALRLLFFALCPEKSIIKFSEFYAQVPDWVRTSIVPVIAFDIVNEFIIKSKGPVGADKVGVVYLPVDEVNHMISNYHGHSYLEETIEAIGTLTTGTVGSVLICPVLAGTVVQPMIDSFTKSGICCVPLPINQLTVEDVRSIVARLSEVDNRSFRGWELSRTFLKSLLRYGTHPKLLGNYLGIVQDMMKNPLYRDVDDLIFSDIDKNMQFHVLQLTTDAAFSDNLCFKLVSAYLLQKIVSRVGPVCDDSHVSYGDLERLGHVILITDSFGLSTVHFPPSLLSVLLCNGLGTQNPALAALRSAIAKIDGKELGSWQDIESFCCSYEIAREMILAAESNDEPVSLGTFFGSDALCGSNVADIRLRLARVVHLGKCKHQLKNKNADSFHVPADGGTWTDMNLRELMVRTAATDMCDSFRVRIDEYGEDYLLCGQMKLYADSVLSRAHVEAELNKVADALFGTKFADKFVLIIFATIVESDVRANIPPRCILVNGSGLRTYFSPEISYQAFPFIQGEAVNVNSADYSALVSLVSGVGPVVGQAIVDERKEGHFVDWANFKARMTATGLRVNFTLAMQASLKYCE